MKIVYIAGKFRGKSNYEVQRNCDRAEDLGLEVAKLGAMPLIPHNNTRNFDGLLEDEFWIEGTLEVMRRCDAVMMVPGWESSTGSRGEHAEALKLSIPVFTELQCLSAWIRDSAPGPSTQRRIEAVLDEQYSKASSAVPAPSWCGVPFPPPPSVPTVGARLRIGE